ncbi:MAG: hypothetical protein ACE5JI_11020, partial [Acidobacteriota bacterium]
GAHHPLHELLRDRLPGLVVASEAGQHLRFVQAAPHAERVRNNVLVGLGCVGIPGALDSESEGYIQRAMEEIRATGKTTLIVIAHRLSTIKGADRIVILDRGSVVGCGCFKNHGSGAGSRAKEEQKLWRRKA